MEDKEKELLEKGWKKEMLCIHIQEYDETAPNKFRRLSYDMGTDFTSSQMGTIQAWISKINNFFPNIKMHASGTGYYMPANNEQTGDGNN